MLGSSTCRRVSVLVYAIAAATLGIDFNIANKPANAGVVELSCTGPYTASYTPGLKLQEQQTTINSEGILNTCLPLVSNPKIVSGRDSSTGTITSSCLLTNQGSSTQTTYYWNNGQYYSIIKFIPVANQKPIGSSVIVQSGTVINGIFKNAMATRTITLVTTDSTKCATTGITRVNGVETITLTSP
ncbi:MAG: hypothetical protein V7K47_29710 [Nostoc sp.]